MTIAWQLAGLSLLAGALVATGAGIGIKRRKTPAERELQRVRAVNERGRLAYGTVTDVDPGTIYYAYSVAGVEYRASQDVAGFATLLPPDPLRLIGPVTLKYSLRNPANSILICESWSGLRAVSKEIVSQ